MGRGEGEDQHLESRDADCDSVVRADDRSFGVSDPIE